MLRYSVMNQAFMTISFLLIYMRIKNNWKFRIQIQTKNHPTYAVMATCKNLKLNINLIIIYIKFVILKKTKCFKQIQDQTKQQRIVFITSKMRLKIFKMILITYQTKFLVALLLRINQRTVINKQKKMKNTIKILKRMNRIIKMMIHLMNYINMINFLIILIIKN